jgi:hypothetical protein
MKIGLTRLRTARVSGVLLVFAITTSPSIAKPAAPQLTLEAVNVRQEGVVSFSTLSLETDTRSDFPAPRFLLGQTEDQAILLHVDVDSIQQVRFNAFTFTAYLSDAKAAGPEIGKFQITGNPTGSFQDVPVRVSFHVTGSTNTTGAILLPVYNATKTDLLQAEEQKEPAYVSISDTTPIPIRLGNVADALPISVTEVTVAETCPKCWVRISSSVNEKNPLVVDPGTNASLPIDLFPSTIPALLQGAPLIKPDVPHDTLAVTLTYHTIPGGSDKKQTIPFKVRFGPGLLGLAVALCGGIALGLTAKYLLTGKLGQANEHAAHAILSACVLGLIAEFIGVLMTSYGNSKLVLFGLDIDPRQLLPAFVLAILVSGGSAVVSSMKDLFGKK